MARRSAVAFSALAILVLATLPGVSAKEPAVLAAVASGDEDLGKTLTAMTGGLRFIDGDGDGAVADDEPTYWDLDNSNSVSTADLRLSHFLGLDAGTEVAVTDADAGRVLTGFGGWFGTAGGWWYADLDSDDALSVGDLRLDEGPTVVTASTAGVGQPLAYPQGAMGPDTYALDDVDSDHRRDRGEGVFLDLDTGSTIGPPVVGIGDLRLTPTTRSSSSVASGGGAGSGAAGDSSSDSGDDSSLRGFDVVLLALVAINLLGLAYVIRLTRFSKPRNPFK